MNALPASKCATSPKHAWMHACSFNTLIFIYPPQVKIQLTTPVFSGATKPYVRQSHTNALPVHSWMEPRRLAHALIFLLRQVLLDSRAA